MPDPTIRGRINDGINWFSAPSRLRDPIVKIVSVLDLDPAVERYLAPAGVFVLMADELRRNPHEDVERVRRMLTAAEGPFTNQVQAMRDYVRAELLPRS
jgi:hypothetical protein